MSRRLIALSLVAGALTILSLWVLLTRGAASLPSMQKPDPVPIALPSAASRPGEAPASQARRLIVPERLPELPVETGANTSAPVVESRRTLRVVMPPGDTPAAGAIVDLTVDPDDSANTLFAKAIGSEAATQKVEARLIADPDGIVRLPDFKGAATVRGACGEFLGRMSLLSKKLGDSPVLRLRPGLAVLVVDAAGLPTPGVPVALVSRFRSSEGRIELSTTGPDGVAILGSPPVRPAGSPRPRQMSEDSVDAVQIAVPLIARVEAIIDPAKLPTNPVKLVLPPTARLAISLVQPDGSPFVQPTTVTIAEVDDGVVRFRADRDAVSVAATNGSASFPFVGLGGALSVRAKPADPKICAAAVVITTPSTAGDELQLTLQCGRRAVLLSGRLVNPAGEPLAGAHVQGWLGEPPAVETAATSLTERTVVTKSDGRFEIRFDSDAAAFAATELQLDVVATPSDTARWLRRFGLDRPRRLTVAIPREARDGSGDLGDIVLPDLDLAGAGNVVDQQGAPVAKARVRIVRREEKRWVHAWDLHQVDGVSGADGAFELRGTVTGPSLGLIAELKDWICPEPAPFEPGQREIRIVVSKAGGIEGSISGIHGRQAPVRIILTGLDADIAARVLNWRDGDLELYLQEGRFGHRELPAGTYAIKLVAHDQQAVLRQIDGIVVKAGEVNRDPRLQGIDLADVMRVRSVTVLDEGSKPIGGATVGAVSVREGKREFTNFESGADGRALVTTTNDPIEVIVSKKGFRSATIAALDQTATVTLKRVACRPVTVRLPESARVPSAPVFIRVSLTWIGTLDDPPAREIPWNDPRGSNSATGRFGQDRKVTLTPNEPGVNEVFVSLVEGDGLLGGGFHPVMQRGQGARVRVTEQDSASVTLDLESGSLEHELEEIRKK